MLEAAEKEAGKKLSPGEAKGEPEYFNFWDAEVKRLAMNEKYLADIRPRLQAAASAGEKPLRLVSRLLVRSDDVGQEANFWCEAVGMQIYADTPTGGKVVAFGPPGILKGDEGGFFAVQIEPKAALAASAKPASHTSGLRLSFVQVATPALIRISKVISNGGELLDGYGYYGLRSPSGVQIRAYVDDRRDPVEFVAVIPSTTDGLKGAAGQIESLGFESRGQYKLVNQRNQEYMPELPPGNVLYTSGDPEKSAQLLLTPFVKEEEKSILESLPSGIGFVQDQDSRPEFDVMEQPEKPTSPVSAIRDARLFITGAAGPSSYATAASPGSELLFLELQRAE